MKGSLLKWSSHKKETDGSGDGCPYACPLWCWEERWWWWVFKLYPKYLVYVTVCNSLYLLAFLDTHITSYRKHCHRHWWTDTSKLEHIKNFMAALKTLIVNFTFVLIDILQMFIFKFFTWVLILILDLIHVPLITLPVY